MQLQQVPKAPSSPPQNPNPNSQQTLQALHFTRLLARLNNDSTGAAEPSRRRSRAVRVAAFASMALAVGPRRVWSRRLLRGLVRRRRRGGGVGRVGGRMARRGDDGADELRRVVPGGGGMDLCRLLKETGDYIKCLLSQVQLMKKIADSCETIHN